MIYTGYFAKIKQYRDMHLKLVSIANHSIHTFGDLATIKFIPLVPGYWIYPWKNDLHNRSDLGKAKLEYIEIYYTKCLNKFTPEKLFEEINSFTKSTDTILLCYEAPPKDMGSNGIIDLGKLEAGKDFCHRHLVSDFLRRGGLPCQEIVLDNEDKLGGLFE
jgi:uncharacterized protein (DUF488 family)